MRRSNLSPSFAAFLSLSWLALASYGGRKQIKATVAAKEAKAKAEVDKAKAAAEKAEAAARAAAAAAAPAPAAK